MNPDVKARIFDPFFTMKERGKGTGLRLSTVYGIVKQHNGYIYLESEPGQGTSSKIYLPVVEKEVQSALPTTSANAGGGTETVLVFEDDAIIRELILAVLTPLGYQILAAESGEEALALSAAHHGTFELFLTDVIMSGMNGRELADRLQSSRPGIKVIFMSGYTDDTIVQHGVLERGVAFL